MARPEDVTVRVAHDIPSLSSVAPSWERLAGQALEANPLYEPWMLLPALQAQPEPHFTCVLVWEGQELVGFFPFVLQRRHKGMPLGVLRSWRHDSWMLCTPLVHAAHARLAMDALLRWLECNDCGASAAEFLYLPTDGPFHAVLADALARHASMVLSTNAFSRALLRREASAEAYIESAMSKGWRKELRRRERRLEERGSVARVAMAAGEDPQPWIADFLRLEASGWKGRQGSALACLEANRRFAEAALAEAARRGRLQMVGLDFDGRPAARCCNLIAGEGSYAFRVAYDESLAYYSPGLMAEVHAIHEFYRLSGVQWMDSMTDPDNTLINRLWKHRRAFQSLMVGVGVWGELWVSALPLMRWAKRRTRGKPEGVAVPPKTRSEAPATFT